jgi:hypothetical protein
MPAILRGMGHWGPLKTSGGPQTHYKIRQSGSTLVPVSKIKYTIRTARTYIAPPLRVAWQELTAAAASWAASPRLPGPLNETQTTLTDTSS